MNYGHFQKQLNKNDMTNKDLKISALLAFIAMFLINCKENDNGVKNNRLDEEKWRVGHQEYIGYDLTDSESVIIDTLQWKDEAEQYLKMQDGETLIIDESKPKSTKMIKSNEKNDGFIFGVPANNKRKPTQSNSKFYIQNKDHTWRRMSRKERQDYLGY
jgi:hypothetical protein